MPRSEAVGACQIACLFVCFLVFFGIVKSLVRFSLSLQPTGLLIPS